VSTQVIKQTAVYTGEKLIQFKQPKLFN